MHAATAVDGMEALTLLPQSNFDLVLLDVEMPGLSGFDVLAQLRATYSRTQLPVIMVTARTAGEDMVEALKIGANDYVTKPIDFQVALARIETHLAHKRAVESLRDSEERYALAVHGANDGLWDWNLVSGQVYWSPRWRSILGLEHSEVSADPNEWLMRVHPEDVGARALDAEGAPGAAAPGISKASIASATATTPIAGCSAAAPRSETPPAWRRASPVRSPTSPKRSWPTR